MNNLALILLILIFICVVSTELTTPGIASKRIISTSPIYVPPIPPTIRIYPSTISTISTIPNFATQTFIAQPVMNNHKILDPIQVP